MIRDVTRVIRHHINHGRYANLTHRVRSGGVESRRNLTRHALDVMTQRGSHASITCDGVLSEECHNS